MSYWDNQKTRMRSGGSTLRDNRVLITKRSIIDGFYDNISYGLVDAYYPSTPLSSTPLDTWITDKSDIRDQKKIVVHPDQDFENGTVVYWKDQYWLTIHTDPEFGDVYSKGILSLCYGSIRWLDSNGDIREAWFTRKTDVSPNFGIDDYSKIIVMPDERRQILVQSNQYTKEFVKDQRFIIDNRCWKIITLDRESNGLVNIVLQESGINPATDRVDLRICDYRENEYSVSILNGDSATIDINQTIQINVEAYRNGEQVDSNEITFSTDNSNIGIVDEVGLVTPVSVGSSVVTATYQGVSGSITINIVDGSTPTDNFTVEIVGGDSIYYSQSANYSAVFKNNGTEFSDVATFTITADDNISATTLASISSQSNNTCIILAGNKPGYVVLHVKNSDETIVGMKRIQIKSYF